MNATERLGILELLGQGKITAAEAADLLSPKSAAGESPADAVLKESASIDASDASAEAIKLGTSQAAHETGRQPSTEGAVAVAQDGKKARWLKIRVNDLSTGRRRVSIALPLGLVGFGLGLARRFGADTSEFGPVDPDELVAMLREGEQGMLVDVEDEDDNEHVQIYLE